VSGVSRPGRVGHSDPKRPSTGSNLEAHFTYNWGVGFCPLDRAVGVNSGLLNRQVMRSELVKAKKRKENTAIRSAGAAVSSSIE
jgi:hypothetical protein